MDYTSVALGFGFGFMTGITSVIVLAAWVGMRKNRAEKHDLAVMERVLARNVPPRFADMAPTPSNKPQA